MMTKMLLINILIKVSFLFNVMCLFFFFFLMIYFMFGFLEFGRTKTG